MARDLEWNRGGLHAGDFTIDPRVRVDRAVVTHAHADHFVRGCGEYWCTTQTVPLLQHRLGPKARVLGVPYGEAFRLGDFELTFFPAGHILGSAQIRLTDGERVYGVSGDFKRERDPSCSPFEGFQCDVWVSESTFAHPTYQWPERRPLDLPAELWEWAQDCHREGLLPVLHAYSLGKTQRLLAELATLPATRAMRIGVETAGYELSRLYETQGIDLGSFAEITRNTGASSLDLAIVSSREAVSRLESSGKKCEQARASGWVDRPFSRTGRGFRVSDHADWGGLISTARQTGAKEVWVYPPQSEHFPLALRGMGILARVPQFGTSKTAEAPQQPQTSRQLAWSQLLGPST